MPDEKVEEVCEGCDGSGIRTDSDPNAGIFKHTIERCDTCKKFETDLDAAFAWGSSTKRSFIIRNRDTGEPADWKDAHSVIVMTPIPIFIAHEQGKIDSPLLDATKGPIGLEKAKEIADEVGFVEVNFVVGLDTLLKNDLESFLDILAERVFGFAEIGDFSYEVIGVTSEGDIILHVWGRMEEDEDWEDGEDWDDEE